MPRTSRSRLLVVLSLVAAMAGNAGVASAASLAVDRVAGTDRFETAVAVSQTAWPAGSSVAFVATGANYADSVAITAAGGAAGPVLLTHTGTLPSSTRNELVRLQPDVVFVLGGFNAVSEAVQFDIAKTLDNTGIIVDRIAGTNRFETAVQISKELVPSAKIVFLASGHDYAAGITAAAAAGVNGGVLLTTAQDSLPSVVANELARINPTLLVAVGDLSPNVVSAAAGFADEIQWIQGSDAVELSAKMSAATWASTIDVVVASAADFPDALASAAWAVAANVPLLLTDPAKLQAPTACEVLRLHASGATIAGGPNAVSSSVATSLTDIKPRAYGCSDPILVQIPDPLPSTEELEVTLYEMTTSPDGTRAYVINNSWNSVEVIDVIEGVWLGRISVGSNPIDLDISVDGKRLYVVNNGSQTISVIDTTLAFDKAEIKQVEMIGAGANSRRSFSVEAASDGKVFVVPALLEASDAKACLQILTESKQGAISLVLANPADGAPIGVTQGFHSADHKLVGMIAPTLPDGATCDEGAEPEPEPTPTATDSEAPAEAQPLSLFTYKSGAWTEVGAWGRNVSEIAYGNVTENGVTGDGSGTGTVFKAVGGASVLGTVTSQSSSTYGLAVAPLQANCPKNRGNPSQCTQLAYNVVVGADGLGAVDVLDITAGTNVAGSFRVIEQIPLESLVGPYGGKNQPNDPAILNQAAVTADARSLVVATEFTVEIIPIG